MLQRRKASKKPIFQSTEAVTGTKFVANDPLVNIISAYVAKPLIE